VSRRGIAVALAFVATGCARPKLGRSDVVQPAPPPPAPSTAPADKAASGPVTIIAPTAGQVLSESALDVRTAGPAGTAALLILDGGVPQSIQIGESAKLDKLAPGTHLLRVVRCDAEGVMSTDKDAFAACLFSVGGSAAGAAAAPAADLAKPLVTVGQPFETVTPRSAGEVVLDVRVDGVALAESGAQVKWQVDGGETQSLFAWPPPEPLTIAGLKPGAHTLKLWLAGKDGKPVSNGPATQVERAFEVLGLPARG